MPWGFCCAAFTATGTFAWCLLISQRRLNTPSFNRLPGYNLFQAAIPLNSLSVLTQPESANSISRFLLLPSLHPVVGHFSCVLSVPSVSLYLPLLVFPVLNSLIPNFEKNPLIYVPSPIKKPQSLLANVLKIGCFPTNLFSLASAVW